MKKRIQISASVDDNRANVTITEQVGDGEKVSRDYSAFIHSPAYIEVGNEYDIPLSRQILVCQVVRAAMRCGDGEGDHD